MNYDEKSSKQDWYQNKNKCQQQVPLQKTDQQWAGNHQQQHTSEHENNNYYHYFENENENETTKTRQRDFNPFDFWTSNHNQHQHQSNENEAYESQAKANQKPTVATCKPKPSKQTHSPKQQQQQAVKSTAQSLAKQQTKVNTQQCYKKFAVGSYAHLLNEPVEEQYETVKKTTSQVKKAKEHEIHEDEIRADYYHDHQSSKNNETEIDFNRIASNVNSTGRQKWKNSSKSTQSNGPKHIIFPTSSEESSSESSSSETESEAPVQRKTTTTTAAATVSNQKKNFYEPTKEEQLNAVNTNRSYTIQVNLFQLV